VTSGIVPQKIYRLIKARVKRCGKSTPVLLFIKFCIRPPRARPNRDGDVLNLKQRIVFGWPSGLVA